MINSILPYYGCKREQAKGLDELFGDHVAWWDLTCGSLAPENEFKLGLCKRFTSNGGDPAVRFRNASASIPEWWKRLQGVQILREDCVKLAEKIEDKVGTVIYVDPPYIEKDCKYSDDFSREKHEELSEVLSRFGKTKVFVSYYDHEIVRELYKEWLVIGRTTKKKVSATGTSTANEIILTNGA